MNLNKLLTSFCLAISVLLLSFNLYADDSNNTEAKSVNKSEKRYALVIGNTNYAKNKLTNPGNDAQDMAVALKKLGFTLVPNNQPVLDANHEGMINAMIEFKKNLEQAPGATAMVYYSGHGIEIDGSNFLFPLGRDFDSPETVKVGAVSVQNWLDLMQKSKARVSIMVLDACRDNPWANSWSNTKSLGAPTILAPIKAPEGFLISYATGPGSTASDLSPNGRNGLYASALLQEIEKKGVTIQEVFANVRQKVNVASKGKQLTGEYSTMSPGALYLAGAPKGAGLSDESLEVAVLVERVNKGDLSALTELEKSPFFQSKIKARNLDKTPQIQAANQNGNVSADGQMQQPSQPVMQADKQTVALTVANSLSSNPEEKALGKAMEAYLKFDQAKSLNALHQQGNLYATMMLARVYKVGLNVAVNQTLAEQYQQTAKSILPKLEGLSQQGNVISTSWLAHQYQYSDLSNDQVKAFKLFERAAEQNYPYAQEVLGSMYIYGTGVTKDDAKAVNWLQKAAEAGNAQGMHSLGMMYKNGKGVAIDEVKAVEWYQKAADAGNSSGMNGLGTMYENGKGVPKDEAKAVQWYQNAAEAWNGTGMSNLGRMYFNGKGVAKDEAKALQWFQKAAEAGNSDGMTNIGFMYANGRGVPKDEAKAVQWYQKAAEAGNSGGMTNLGIMYANGRGVFKDEVKAFYWFENAADAGVKESMFNLGFAYENSIGIPKNLAKAIQWYKNAAALGDKNSIQALKRLGISYP